MAAVLAALVLVGAAIMIVAAAVVALAVVVVVAAPHVGALGQDAGDELHDRHIGAAVNAGVQVDARCAQGLMPNACYPAGEDPYQEQRFEKILHHHYYPAPRLHRDSHLHS